MNEYAPELASVEQQLAGLSHELVTNLNSIYQSGVPALADKIVFWIPLGERYNLTCCFMTNDADEVGNTPNCFKRLNLALERLLSSYTEKYDSEAFNELSARTDDIFAKWLQSGLEKSKFNTVSLYKVMAINNVCAYFDLTTLQLLDDEDMWY